MSSFSRTADPWFPKGSLFSKFIICRCGRQVPDNTVPENCTHCKIIKTKTDAYDQLCIGMTGTHTVVTSKDVNIVHVVQKTVDIVPAVTDVVQKTVDIVPAVTDVVPTVPEIVKTPANFVTIVKCATQGCRKTVNIKYNTSSYCCSCEENQPLIKMLTMHFGQINQNYIFKIVVCGTVYTCVDSCMTPEGNSPTTNYFEYTLYLPALQSALDDSNKINCESVCDEHYKSRAINFYLSFLSYHYINDSLICMCRSFKKQPKVKFFSAVPMNDKYKMSRFYGMALRARYQKVDMRDVSNFLNAADTDTDTDTDTDRDTDADTDADTDY